MSGQQREGTPAAGACDAAFDPAAYWSARLAEPSSIEAIGWRGLGAAYNRWLYRRRASLFRQVVHEYGFDRDPPRVLDLGPGAGFYVEQWSRLGVGTLTGIDIAPSVVAHLRTRLPTFQFLSGDISRTLALPPGSFDVVTAFDLLFHIVDDAGFERALATIHRALRPGGLALITDLFPERDEIRLPHHVSRTRARYRAALASAGLTVERIWPVFVLMHPWSAPRRGVVGRAAGVWWAFVERVAGHVPGAGGPLGAGLFLADSSLARVVGPGPSTQLWALRRGTSGGGA